MTSRAFVVLMFVTVLGIWFGDRIADDFAAPGLERTFSVFVIAAAIVAPVAWGLERIGWIRGRLELGRKRDTDTAPRGRDDGGAA
jgi:uncharacterized membrane protein YfcA